MKPARHYQTEILETVNLDRSQVLAIGDRIQRLAPLAPKLTIHCTMSMPMKARRLLTLPAQSWHELEIRWARELLAEIARLELLSGPEVELALACCGVEREGLAEAMELLERTAGSLAAEDPQPVEVQDGPKEKVQNEKIAPKEKERKARAASAPSAPAGDELDPETARMLAEVLAEAQAAKTAKAGEKS